MFVEGRSQNAAIKCQFFSPELRKVRFLEKFLIPSSFKMSIWENLMCLQSTPFHKDVTVHFNQKTVVENIILLIFDE